MIAVFQEREQAYQALIDEANREIAPPGTTFRTTLTIAIDRLLDVPVLDGTVSIGEVLLDGKRTSLLKEGTRGNKSATKMEIPKDIEKVIYLDNAATVSDGGQRRNSANAGSSRPAARKSLPRLNASRSSFFSSPASHVLSAAAPTNIAVSWDASTSSRARSARHSAARRADLRPAARKLSAGCVSAPGRIYSRTR